MAKRSLEAATGLMDDDERSARRYHQHDAEVVADHGAALIVLRDGKRITVKTATASPIETAPF